MASLFCVKLNDLIDFEYFEYEYVQWQLNNSILTGTVYAVGAYIMQPPTKIWNMQVSFACWLFTQKRKRDM